MPTDPTNQPATPSELWGLWSDAEQRWLMDRNIYLFAWPTRERAEEYGAHLGPSYRPVRLVPAGSEVVEVVREIDALMDALKTSSGGAAFDDGWKSALAFLKDELQTKGE